MYNPSFRVTGTWVTSINILIWSRHCLNQRTPWALPYMYHLCKTLKNSKGHYKTLLAQRGGNQMRILVSNVQYSYLHFHSKQNHYFYLKICLVKYWVNVSFRRMSKKKFFSKSQPNPPSPLLPKWLITL